MSINIQTARGLKKLSGENVTKEKITTALGYTPSDFSGNYHDLQDKPNITDDGSAEIAIVDPSGNKIFQVDQNGTHNLDVFIGPMSQEVSVGKKLEELKNITEDHSGEFMLADENGNIAFKVSSDGITKAAKLSVGGKDLETIISEHTPDIPDFEEIDPTVPDWAKTANKPSYTAAEVGAATPTDLDNLQKEMSEQIVSESNEWHVVDGDGNIVATIDAQGVHSTEVWLPGGKVSDMVSQAQTDADTADQLANEALKNIDDIEDKIKNFDYVYQTAEEAYAIASRADQGLNQHAEDSDIHVTSAEKAKWNNSTQVTKESLGLDQVDNTSDAKKPVSEAQQTAIDEAKKQTGIYLLSTTGTGTDKKHPLIVAPNYTYTNNSVICQPMFANKELFWTIPSTGELGATKMVTNELNVDGDLYVANTNPAEFEYDIVSNEYIVSKTGCLVAGDPYTSGAAHTIYGKDDIQKSGTKSYTYTLPSDNGTLALTSQIPTLSAPVYTVFTTTKNTSYQNTLTIPKADYPRIITVCGRENAEHGGIVITTDNNTNGVIAEVQGEEGFWGANRLSVTAVLEPNKQYYIYSQKMSSGWCRTWGLNGG